MMVKPTCLHVPPLYEYEMAKIFWESADEADDYELDCHFDEDFDTASTGKTWADIEDAASTWEKAEESGLTWAEISALPAQGLSWRNIMFSDLSWEEIEKKSLSWSGIQRLPVRFTVFKGAGEKKRGPDQGLTWANIGSAGLTWSDILEKAWSWEDFQFKESIGLTWAQWEGPDWTQIMQDGKSWYDIEYQRPYGLSWDSLQSRYLTWGEIESKDLTWKDFHILPPDSKTHISHSVDITPYKKRAVVRVRSCKDDEYSPYLTSTLIPIIPVFYREDDACFSVIKGCKYTLQLCVSGIKSLRDIEMTLEYNPLHLKLDSFSYDRQSGQGMRRDHPTQINERHHKDGRLCFTCGRTVVTNTKLSATVAEAIFTATGTGDTTVQIF